MKVEVKILEFYFFTVKGGWMYILDKNYFLPGDTITDGIKEYKIRQDEPEIYTKFRFPVPFSTWKSGDDGYLYHFEERIDDFENKVFTKL